MTLYILDLVGTAVFAVTGALKAIDHELDILGVSILSLVTGVGGGIFRDLLLGSTPPTAFHDERYLLVCIVAGVGTALLARRVLRIWRVVQVLDAVGLGVFTAIGVAKGASCQLGGIGVLFTGAITAVGGGMVRDVLVREIPAVISRDFYATASFIGGGVFLVCGAWTLPQGVQIAAVAVVTTTIRLIALKTNLSLPRVKRVVL